MVFILGLVTWVAKNWGQRGPTCEEDSCGVCHTRVSFLRLDRTPQIDSGAKVCLTSAKMVHVPKLIEALRRDAPSAESAIGPNGPNSRLPPKRADYEFDVRNESVLRIPCF